MELNEFAERMRHVELNELGKRMLEQWESHRIPGFLTQMIDHTTRGLIEWRRVRPNRYKLLGRGVPIYLDSRNGDGNPPYVLIIDKSETVGASDDPVYNEAFAKLFAAVEASVTGAQRS